MTPQVPGVPAPPTTVDEIEAELAHRAPAPLDIPHRHHTRDCRPPADVDALGAMDRHPVDDRSMGPLGVLSGRHRHGGSPESRTAPHGASCCQAGRLRTRHRPCATSALELQRRDLRRNPPDRILDRRMRPADPLTDRLQHPIQQRVGLSSDRSLVLAEPLLRRLQRVVQRPALREVQRRLLDLRQRHGSRWSCRRRRCGSRRLRWRRRCSGHDGPPRIGDEARTVAHAINPNPA